MNPSTETPANTPAPIDPDADADALETPEGGAQLANATTAASPPPQKPRGGFKATLKKFNLYLLLFVFILLIAGAVIVVSYLQSKQAGTKADVTTQKLDQKALNQLADSNATVGDPKQVLSVQSNAVFAGKVLVRDTIEVAGNLQVGGSGTFATIAVAGKSALGDASVSQNLSVTGDTALQGGLSVQKALQVNGNGTFSGTLAAGQITTSTFMLNGDLSLTHHITAGGPTPSRSNGAALGSGGSSSVSGSDTSGSININTGSGAGAGCFITVNFAQKYNSVPHVTVTPVGADAGSLDYYVTRTATSFSVCDASAPPAGASFGFDYFVVN